MEPVIPKPQLSEVHQRIADRGQVEYDKTGRVLGWTDAAELIIAEQSAQLAAQRREIEGLKGELHGLADYATNAAIVEDNEGDLREALEFAAKKARSGAIGSGRIPSDKSA